MDVDTSAAGSSRSPTSEQPMSALQDVAANLASVKSAIKTGAADRNQVIDMLTNLLRETLQVRPPLLIHMCLSDLPCTAEPLLSAARASERCTSVHAAHAACSNEYCVGAGHHCSSQP